MRFHEFDYVSGNYDSGSTGNDRKEAVALPTPLLRLVGIAREIAVGIKAFQSSHLRNTAGNTIRGTGTKPSEMQSFLIRKTR